MDLRGDLHRFFERPDESLYLSGDLADRLAPHFRQSSWFETGESMLEAGFMFSAPLRSVFHWRRFTFYHPDLPEWEFHGSPWKGAPDRSLEVALRSEGRRVRRSREISALVEERGFDRLMVPEEWIFVPPWEERLFCVRVSRRLKVDLESRSRYWEIDLDQLRQLLELLALVELPFEGISDHPFLEDGRIALGFSGELMRRIDGVGTRLLRSVRPEVAREGRSIWTDLLWRREEEVQISSSLAREYLLSTTSLEGEALLQLCRGQEIFSDRASLVDAGFELLGRGKRSFQIMVARHPGFPGYVIKTFPLLGDSRSAWQRLDQYLKRCRNAERIREEAKARGWRYIDAVAKGVFPIGEKFLLVAEESTPMEEKRARKWQHDIPMQVLEELIEFYRLFGSSDSSWCNHPVTEDGRIVWIDTEFIGSPEKGELYPALRHMIGPQRWKLALDMWDRLK